MIFKKSMSESVDRREESLEIDVLVVEDESTSSSSSFWKFSFDELSLSAVDADEDVPFL